MIRRNLSSKDTTKQNILQISISKLLPHMFCESYCPSSQNTCTVPSCGNRNLLKSLKCLLLFQPGENIIPRDEHGKLLFDTVDLCDTWAVSHWTREHRGRSRETGSGLTSRHENRMCTVGSRNSGRSQELFWWSAAKGCFAGNGREMEENNWVRQGWAPLSLHT